jgi:hypothetical protein
MKRYALKGINDDQTECSVCGKVELNRVMWLVELDEEGNEISEPFFCGTTCGAKLMNQKISKIRTITANFDSTVDSIRRDLKFQKERELGYEEVYNEFKDIRGWANRRAHPAFDRALAIQKQAFDWANSQPVKVEIA